MALRAWLLEDVHVGPENDLQDDAHEGAWRRLASRLQPCPYDALSVRLLLCCFLATSCLILPFFLGLGSQEPQSDDTSTAALLLALRGGASAIIISDDAKQRSWHWRLEMLLAIFLTSIVVGCIVLTWWRRPTWPQSFIADNAMWDGSYWETLKGRASALRVLLKNLKSGDRHRVREIIQECCCGRDTEWHECDPCHDEKAGMQGFRRERSESFTSLPSLVSPAEIDMVEHGLGTMHRWCSEERPPPRAIGKEEDPGPMWTPGPGRGLDVRHGPNYRKSKGKQAANGHMYNCISMDVIRSNQKIDRILGEVLPVPEPVVCSSSGSMVGPCWTAACKLPRVICVNVQVPYRGVNPFGYHDPGCSVLTLFHITCETVKNVEKDSTCSPGLRLFRDFWRGEAGRLDNRKDPQERATFTAGIFKAIAFCTNIEECIEGMPMADTAAGFNGKPCLITKSGNLIKDPNGEWMEISVDLRLFATLARTMLALQRDRIAKASIHVGFMIQGVEDEELPEELIGDAIIHNVDLEKDPKSVSKKDE